MNYFNKIKYWKLKDIVNQEAISISYNAQVYDDKYSLLKCWKSEKGYLKA